MGSARKRYLFGWRQFLLAGHCYSPHNSMTLGWQPVEVEFSSTAGRPMRRFVSIALVGLCAVVLAACFPTVTAPAGYKPLIVGLIDKGSEAPYHQGVAYPVVDTSDVAAQSPAFAGIVVNQTWSQLEPSQGTFDFTTLEASLAGSRRVQRSTRRCAARGAAPGVRGLRRTRLGQNPRRPSDHRTGESPRQYRRDPRPVVEARVPVGLGGTATGAGGALRHQPRPTRGRCLFVLDSDR